jgi:hypothetical protein
MTVQSILLLVAAFLVRVESLKAATPTDRQRERSVATANLKVRKDDLEIATKLGPEKFDEVLKALGIEDPGALFQLEWYRKVRAEIVALENANDPKNEAKIKALQEKQDTFATGVFEQFDAILVMLRNRIKAQHQEVMRLDAVRTPAQRK